MVRSPKVLVLALILILAVCVIGQPSVSFAQGESWCWDCYSGPSCSGEGCCPDYPVWCYDPGCSLDTDPCCHNDNSNELTCCNISCGPCGNCSNGVCSALSGPVTNCVSAAYFTGGSASASPSVVCVSNSVTFTASPPTPVPGTLQIITTADTCSLSTNYTTDSITGTDSSWSLSGGASGPGSSLTTNLPPGVYIWTCTVTATNAICGVVSTNLICTGTVVAIETYTEAATPANTDRTTIGVGERVNLSPFPTPTGTITWTTTGYGTFSPPVGPTTWFTAPYRASTEVITASFPGGSCSIPFTVIEPSGTHMQYQDGSYKHTQGYPDIGMLTRIYVGPDNVNFYNIVWKEEPSYCVATGIYLPFNNVPHDRYPTGVAMTTIVTPGLGTLVTEGDQIYSGRQAGAPPPVAPGTEDFSIPDDFRVGFGDWKDYTFPPVNQHVQCDAAGALTASKAGAIINGNVTDTTSWPW